jgi:phosphoadenosine phosphosulfate reductase
MKETYMKTKPDTSQINLSGKDLVLLNKKYRLLTPEKRIQEVYNDFDRVLLTSSFGTTAVYQLHLYYKQNIKQPVHFINTTFHFKETHEYKKTLTSLFDLEVIDINPNHERNQITKEVSLWEIDPNQCCKINKIDPLENIQTNYNLWISGLMRWQSNHRERLDIFEQGNGIIKFYPILDINEEQILDYIARHNLPIHPLKNLGYESIGCMHCTSKGKKRKGRWSRTMKTECGLHL